MRFNTGNPVEPDGSSDPRDLYDTAGIVDLLVTGEEDSTKDRLGRDRKSWKGIENDFQQAQTQRGEEFALSQSEREAEFVESQNDKNDRFQQLMDNSQYEPMGNYAAGINITSRNQIIWKDGEYYRIAASASIPYTTTGDWATDSPKFVSVGDAALRQDLAAVDGSSKVTYRGPGGVARSVKSKLDDFVSIKDFAPGLVDGDDFTTAFANAIAACAGRALWLPKGLYLVTDIQVTNSIRIWGEPGAILKQKALSDRHFIQCAADNINLELRGFTVDQNNSQQTFHQGLFALNSVRSNIGMDLEGMVLKDFCEGAIRIVGDRDPATRERLRVFNNKFTGGMESVAGVYNTFTIFAADASEVVIEQNDFDHGLTLVHGGIPAISIGGVNTTSFSYTKVAIRNNKFKGYGRFTEGSGIGVVDCYAWAESVEISGNLFEQSHVTPIRGKVNAQNVIISRNLCRDFAGTGPDFCGGISLVSATLAPTQGRYIISENIILGAPYRGIEISATGVAPGSILVVNNIVGAVGNIGIYVLNCEGFAVRGNIVRSSGQHGIAFSGCSGLGAINSNEIIAPALAGVISIGAAQANLSITIHENEVVGSNSVGITAENVAYLSLQNNLVKDVVDGGAAGQRGYRVGGGTGIPIAEIKNNTALGAYASGQFNMTNLGITQALYEGGNTWNPREIHSFAPPTTGTWTRTDRCINTAPVAGGNLGWVCVATGTPGTWKAYGAISA